MLGKGRIKWGSDFTGIYDSIVWGAGSLVATLDGSVGFTSVNEGSFASTVDETGGVLAITTDTGDNDNAALIAGKFSPRDGKMVVRGRWKLNNVTTLSSVYFGFAETMALDTPVMPAEFATATMTYNPGGMIGFNFDIDGTTDDYRAVMGDGSAAISDSSNGIRATATLTADSWVEGEVILNEDGSGECWLGQVGTNDSNAMSKLKLVKRFFTGTLLTPTDTFFAVLMAENRTAGAFVFEVDYFEGEAGRDWRTT
jgi:hypothetical protein